MNKDFAQKAYEDHRQLFQHYSSLVFKSRLSPATVIVLVFGYLVGLLPSSLSSTNVLPGVFTSALLPYLVAVLTPVLFAMETAYLKRLVEVAEAAAEVERTFGASLYFDHNRQSSEKNYCGNQKTLYFMDGVVREVVAPAPLLRNGR